MFRQEILISGFGGQGVVMAGRILGCAAVLYGLQATMLVSHGTETRGGYVRSQVIISNEVIDSPVAENPDIFCALSQAAWNRFSFLMKQGLVLYDPDVVNLPVESVESPPQFARLAVSASAKAEKIGSRQFANAVFLGAAVKKLKSVPLEKVKLAIQRTVPRFTGKNIQALETGYGCNL